MENQVNDTVEDLRNAMDGMVIRVVTGPIGTKDLLKVGGLAVLGSAIGTTGAIMFANWRQKRQLKKNIEELSKEFES